MRPQSTSGVPGAQHRLARFQGEAEVLAEPAVMHVSLPLPEGGAAFLSVSPDGRRVLAGRAVRDLDAGEWTLIESARRARTPFWSPDGRSIGSFADGTSGMTLENGACRDLQAEPAQMLSESGELVDVGRENRVRARSCRNAEEIVN